jgi:hypothetical protein
MDEARKARMDIVDACHRKWECRSMEIELAQASAKLVEQQNEIDELRKLLEKQQVIIRRIYAEQLPDTWFVCGELGEKDQNNLPKYIEVCPAYGVDWSQLYERTDRTIGGMGS